MAGIKADTNNKLFDDKGEFLIKLAKSVDELHKKVVLLEKIKTPQVVYQPPKEKEASLTVASIWTTTPTEEEKTSLHNNIAVIMKNYGILQANIHYEKNSV